MEESKKHYFIDNNNAFLGKSSFFVKLAVILIALIIIVISFSMLMKYGEKQDQKAALQKRLAEQEQKVEELQYLVGAPIDRDYIIRVAREKLGLVLPEDIIYYNEVLD